MIEGAFAKGNGDYVPIIRLTGFIRSSSEIKYLMRSQVTEAPLQTTFKLASLLEECLWIGCTQEFSFALLRLFVG